MHYLTQVLESERPGQLILVKSESKRNQQKQQTKFLLQLDDFEEKVCTNPAGSSWLWHDARRPSARRDFA